MNLLPLRSGKSVEGQEIEAFKSELKGEKYLYLMAGVHGDEVEGVYVLSKLYEWIKENDDINIPMIVIPVLNIDGHRMEQRVNAHGVDLNRNLKTSTWSKEFSEAKYNPGAGPMSEPENQFLDKCFKKFRPGMIISFHSWRPCLNYNDDCRDLCELLSTLNHYEVVGDIGYPTPGSLGTYAPEVYQSPVITFECPTLAQGKSLNEIWQENQDGLMQLLRSDLLAKKVSEKR